MTKAVSLVRLVPISDSSGSSRRYVAEYKLPGDPEWTKAGQLSIHGEAYVWEPTTSAAGFDDIEVRSHDLYTDFANRFDPILFARYKIRKFISEIIQGEWPSGEVVPPGFADTPPA
jgi:hypothetical protein